MTEPINWPSGYTTFYHNVRLFADKITSGTLIAIDPSSGGSSMPGFALFYAGTLQTSGSIQLNKKTMTIQERLAIIYEKISKVSPVPPDVLAIEMIRGRTAHFHLQWSIGTAVAAAQAPIMLEMPCMVWKRLAARTPGYVKGDEADAVMIGAATIALAKEMLSGNFGSLSSSPVA